MMTRRLPAPIFLVALVVVAAGCDDRNPKSEGPIVAASPLPGSQKLALPDAEYGWIAWADSDYLFVDVTHGSGPALLERIGLDGSHRRVANEPVDGCPIGFNHHPIASGDGNLFAIRDCGEPFPPEESVVTLDPTNGRSLDIVVSRSVEPISDFSLGPNGLVSVVVLGRSLCTTIAQVVDGQVGHMDITVGTGSHVWNLRDGYSAGGDCATFGRAWAPSWSPDGSVLAFMGSPQSIGVDGSGRGDEPGNLYFLPKDGSEPVRQLSDLGNVIDIAWSPSGHLLAFSGDVPGQGHGVWLLEPQTKALTLVTWLEGPSFAALAWSPTGDRLAIAMNRYLGEGQSDSNVTVIPIPR